MRQSACPNGPSWSDEAIALNWPALASILPRAWLPIRAADTELTCRPSFDEYGCGSYGCVYVTDDESVVFKITSDPTEADFVGLLGALRSKLPGVVRYHAIYRLKGERKRVHVGRTTHMPLYAIVRESAEKVGKMDEVGGSNRSSAQRVLGLLTSFKEIAGSMRKAAAQAGAEFAIASYEGRHDEDAAKYLRPTQPTEFRPAARIRPAQTDLHIPTGSPDWPDDRQGALAYGALIQLAKRMEHEPVGFWIGSALYSLLEGGIILADVHHKNVGVVTRSAESAWVITDPGHSVRLRQDLPRPVIDQL